MKKFTFSLLIVSIFYVGAGTGTASAQRGYSNLQPKAFGLLGQAFGPELLGIYLKYHVSHMLAAHAGLGLRGDYHGGVNFYFATHRNGNWNVYLGPQLISVKDYRYDILLVNDPNYHARQRGFYTPVGLEFMGKKGLTFQLEAGPSYVKKNYGQLNTKPFLFSLRLGHTFLRSK